MKVFNESNKWFKGNLHTHTTNSDGLVTPESCLRLYSEKNYSFISLTDHYFYNESGKFEDMLIISGSECHATDSNNLRSLHIVALNINNDIELRDGYTPQKIIDMINERSGIPIIAHPAWSLLTTEEVKQLKGYIGVEIWNGISETETYRGDSSNFVDILASNGVYPILFAADDTHFYGNELFSSYIMVNSPSNQMDDIISNIKVGNFYCSQGPEIKQIEINKDTISIETSSVSRIVFFSNTFYCSDRVVRADKGNKITEATYKIKETDRYVRIECVDDDDKKAWSQIIILENK